MFVLVPHDIDECGDVVMIDAPVMGIFPTKEEAEEFLLQVADYLHNEDLDAWEYHYGEIDGVVHLYRIFPLVFTCDEIDDLLDRRERATRLVGRGR
ncbi:MAG: hypothetical protein ABH822_01005 [Patescibacteria group bacterium]